MISLPLNAFRFDLCVTLKIHRTKRLLTFDLELYRKIAKYFFTGRLIYETSLKTSNIKNISIFYESSKPNRLVNFTLISDKIPSSYLIFIKM